MSMLVIGHMTVDPANVEKLWKDRRADFETVREHAEAFQRFFAAETIIGELMQAAGVQGPPEFEIVEARTGPDEF
jgi:hypothetical protein